MEDKVKITIDGIEMEVPKTYTILDAAREAGIDIPTLCHLKDINEIGACRMCIVEVEGARGEAGYITGGPDVFMVNSESKHPDEAIKFLKWLTSDDVQAKMAYELGFLPCTGVELDTEKCMPELLDISQRNLQAPGISEWLDCAMNQTVADTYLIGCQTIFETQTGADVMTSVTEIAKEEAAE